MLQARLYFDYVDPGSLVVERRLDRIAPARGVAVERVPFEVRPPPEPLIDPHGAVWSRYWSQMIEEARGEGLEIQAPGRVPWTRKAHELGLHAREKGLFEEVHEALFRALLTEGRDLGRVDVLVELGRECGLDRGETKVALDVDRHTAELLRRRKEAEAAGVQGVPTLVVQDRHLEGVPSPAELSAFMDELDELDERD
jgi:predicted DsbA family dithiol-disulfide isomerase